MKYGIRGRLSFYPLTRLIVTVALALALCSGFVKPGMTQWRMASLPGHFGIGVENAPNQLSWMTGAGAAWDYRYQYLNQGWQSWDPQFVSHYTQQSQSQGYAPVFTWYEIGSTGLWFWDRLNYLSNPGNMYNYYGDYVQMLQQIAAVEEWYPGVIVHIEPDLWGYMQQGYGDNPSMVPVAVASSGYPGLGSFPDNAAGFAQALVQLRDWYAPNVVLAWHASLWGPNNGYDPTLTSPASYQTPQLTGVRVANFYNGLGAGFDMIFHDPSDATSAYKVIMWGQSANTAWWSNAAFASYLQYIAEIYQQTGLPSMLWQVPSGNTLYDTENNSLYHFQDNRAQYFLSSGNIGNVWNFAAQGVIGLLFGTGQSGDTDFMDYSGQGVFNPAPIDGNTLWSSYPDDDGGFLQSAAAAYYAGGAVPLASEAQTAKLRR